MRGLTLRAQMAVIVIESPEQYDKVCADAKAEGKKVIVDFTATWCGPCKMIKPFFHELAEATPSVVFVQVDVDDMSMIAEKARVSAMPTFHVYDGTEKVDELVGASKDKLAALAAKHK
eukprot:PRCOL_00005210-RA